MPNPRSDAALRIIFAGTPTFAVPSLQALIDLSFVEVSATFTQPDRAAGRGRTLQASAVKVAAAAHGIPVLQPTNWKDPAVLHTLEAHRPDLLVVAAYGVILPAAALAIPRLGAVNVHASLLPRWRGAAPLQRAIMAGDQETGISIMQIVPALDAGPVLFQLRCAIEDDETGGTLDAKLAVLGAAGLCRTLEEHHAGKQWISVAQDSASATYAAKLTREDRQLAFSEPAAALARRIRALSPSPLACVELGGLQINIGAASVVASTGPAAPGSIVQATPEGIDFATAVDTLRVTALQPPGKRSMPARDFLNGYARVLQLR